VANKEYIERIQMVIAHLHGADSKHVKSVPVHEVFRGQTVWKGIVEVFDLTGHPKAKRCYAWSHPEGPDDRGERFVTVLELPPVVSAKTAVKVAAANDIKKQYDYRKAGR
jgi:hypothetical protein